MRFVGQIEDSHALRRNAAVREGRGEAARDIRIHSVAGDILAHLVDYEHVHRIERDRGQIGFGPQQQRGLFFHDFVAVEYHELPRLVIRVLQNGDAAEDRGFFQEDPREHRDFLLHQSETVRVQHSCAFLLAEADAHHLADAAFIRPAERRVRLYAADHEDSVGLRGVTVAIDGLAVFRRTQHDGFHRRADLTAHRFFGNSERRDYGFLSLGRRSAMAAHSRHDERHSAFQYSYNDQALTSIVLGNLLSQTLNSFINIVGRYQYFVNIFG